MRNRTVLAMLLCAIVLGWAIPGRAQVTPIAPEDLTDHQAKLANFAELAKKLVITSQSCRYEAIFQSRNSYSVKVCFNPTRNEHAKPEHRLTKDEEDLARTYMAKEIEFAHEKVLEAPKDAEPRRYFGRVVPAGYVNSYLSRIVASQQKRMEGTSKAKLAVALDEVYESMHDEIMAGPDEPGASAGKKAGDKGKDWFTIVTTVTPSTFTKTP